MNRNGYDYYHCSDCKRVSPLHEILDADGIAGNYCEACGADGTVRLATEDEYIDYVDAHSP